MSRILVVEDEPILAAVFEEFLEDAGYDVSVAPDGRMAAQVLTQSEAPDLVLLDLFIPGVSGKAVLELIRSHKSLRNVPVILITGALKDGSFFPSEDTYQGYFSKPFNLDHVLQSIEALLRSHTQDGLSQPGHP